MATETATRRYVANPASVGTGTLTQIFFGSIDKYDRADAQRVRDADIVHADSPEGRITVSIGVANMAADDREAEDMLRRADGAMYRAKHAGRNRVSD